METYIPVIRKIFVIGIWIYVGVQMLPAARSHNRNPVLWYIIGLFAFYIPFALIGFVPPVLMLIAMKNGTEIASSVFNGVGITVFCLGISVGFACLHRAKAVAAAPPTGENTLPNG